jgi:hypothetical protein
VTRITPKKVFHPRSFKAGMKDLPLLGRRKRRDAWRTFQQIAQLDIMRKPHGMSKKPKGLQQTYQVRLYPTPEQGRLLMAHCQEYISTVNVLSSALDVDLIPHDDTFSTKDFTTVSPTLLLLVLKKQIF